MGQNQSSEKPSVSRSGTPQADKDRKVNRRISVQTLSNPRAQPADTSASTTHAVAQGTSSHNVEKANLHHILQSTSPELTNRTNRVERSVSRASRKRDLENRSTNQQTPEIAVPTTLPTSVPSGSIDIPTPSTATRTRQDEIDENHRTYQERQYAPISHLRPPRLPLPIADVPIPESPTLLPVDKSGNADVPIFETDDPLAPIPEQSLRRKSSIMSVTTQDEEEIADELQPYGVGFTGQTVPTVIGWNHQPAEKVFVTGTFAAWDKKFRLTRRKSQPDKFKTTINLPPGTHHLKFFVDGQMVTSDDLPTAVDFNNILVNYIEISTDDIPRRRESHQAVSKSIPLGNQNQTLPEDSEETYSNAITPGEEDDRYEEFPREEILEGDFRQLIPQALIDIDYAEDDPRYKQAAQIIQDGAGPPSLPLFLSRSILNGILPVKDDSSVLTLPNHTVLNHLMTSSVRNGVLATSVTTRYKKKYVTTISFKPVPR